MDVPIKIENDITCSGCSLSFDSESNYTKVLSGCRHLFCSKCIETIVRTPRGSLKCPYCKGEEMMHCSDCKQSTHKRLFTTCATCITKNKTFPVAKSMVVGFSEKFRKLPTCGCCSQPFDPILRIPKILDTCGHVICLQCVEETFENESLSTNVLRNDYVFCKVCGVETRLPKNGVRDLETDESVLRICEQMVENIRKEEESIYVTCTECTKSDIEKDMHICQGCTLEKHGFDIKNINKANSNINVDLFAICSTCVLKEHIMKGHKIYEFYPIRASFHIMEDRNSMGMSANNLEAVMDQFCKTWEITSKIVNDSKNELDRMVNLMIRSKSTNVRKHLCSKHEENTKMTIQYLNKFMKTINDLNKVQEKKLKFLSTTNTNLEVNYCHPLNGQKVKISAIQHPVYHHSHQESNHQQNQSKLLPPPTQQPEPEAEINPPTENMNNRDNIKKPPHLIVQRAAIMRSNMGVRTVMRTPQQNPSNIRFNPISCTKKQVALVPAGPFRRNVVTSSQYSIVKPPPPLPYKKKSDEDK